MWFGKAVEDFNNAIELQGDRAPQLIAEISNGFISTFLAYDYSESADLLNSGMGGLRVPCYPNCMRSGKDPRYRSPGWKSVNALSHLFTNTVSIRSHFSILPLDNRNCNYPAKSA